MEKSKKVKGKPAFLHSVKKNANLRTCHAQERGDEDLGTEEIVLKSQKSRQEEAVLNCTG